MDFFYGSVSLAATVLGFVFLAIYAFAVLIRDDSEEKRKKNKKRWAPVAGTVFHQLLNFRQLYDYHTELSRKHKTFRLLAPSCQQIYTTDPAVVEYFLKTNFQNFGKGWYNHEILEDMFGDGIFTVDGEKWRQQRKLASFGFSTKALRDFSGDIFKRTAAKLACVISSFACSNEKFDVQDLLMKSTMDSIFQIGFGVELNCLDGSDGHDGSEFARAFDAGNELLVLRYVNPLWKIMRYLNIGYEATLKAQIKLVDEFLYKLINLRIQQISSTENDSTKKGDILSKFLEESMKDPKIMNLQYLRDVILNLVIAGKDSTAGTLSWFLYLICKNPLVQEKIYQEVKQVIEAGGEADFDAFSRSINDESLNKMQYLHAALSETLRLYPAGPLDSKVCFSDDTLPGGYSVRKGDVVFYQSYPMGRMEYLWGEDAEVFRPERWLDDDGVFQPESPFKFAAFQAGPRICLGKEFAYRQMKIFAAVLLCFFRFKLSDEKKAVHYKTTTTLLVDEGPCLEAFRR